MHRLVDLSLVATMCVTERSRYIKDYMTQMHGVMSHESLFSDTLIPHPSCSWVLEADPRLQVYTLHSTPATFGHGSAKTPALTVFSCSCLTMEIRK